MFQESYFVCLNGTPCLLALVALVERFCLMPVKGTIWKPLSQPLSIESHNSRNKPFSKMAHKLKILWKTTLRAENYAVQVSDNETSILGYKKYDIAHIWKRSRSQNLTSNFYRFHINFLFWKKLQAKIKLWRITKRMCLFWSWCKFPVEINIYWLRLQLRSWRRISRDVAI